MENNKVYGTEVIVIHDFMRNKLNLSGTELLIYAYLYGKHSRIPDEIFEADPKEIDHIADWIGCDRNEANRQFATMIGCDVIKEVAYSADHQYVMINTKLLEE